MAQIRKKKLRVLRTTLLGFTVILVLLAAGVGYEVSAPAAGAPTALTLSIVTDSKAPGIVPSLARLISRQWSSSANLKSYRTTKEEEQNLHELLSVQIAYEERDHLWARVVGNISNADALFLYAHYVDGRWTLLTGTGPIDFNRPSKMPAGRLLSADAVLTWHGTPKMTEINLKNLFVSSCSNSPRLSGSFARDGRETIQCTMLGINGRSIIVSIFANSAAHVSYLNAVLRPSREAAMLRLGKPYGLVNSFGWTALAPKTSTCGVQATLGGEIVWPKTQQKERLVQGPFDKGCTG